MLKRHLNDFLNVFPRRLFSRRFVSVAPFAIVIFLRRYRHDRIPDGMTGNRTGVCFNQARSDDIFLACDINDIGDYSKYSGIIVSR